MTISSLLLTLSPEESARRQALATLAADPRLTLGEPIGDRLPLVLETPSAREAAQASEALLDVTGVTFVELVTVHFEDQEEEPWTAATS